MRHRRPMRTFSGLPGGGTGDYEQHRHEAKMALDPALELGTTHRKGVHHVPESIDKEVNAIC